MEKFWMIQLILDENKTSKHHAFTKETLHDDGDWFKAVQAILLNLQCEMSKSLKHRNKTYITTVLQPLKNSSLENRWQKTRNADGFWLSPTCVFLEWCMVYIKRQCNRQIKQYLRHKNPHATLTILFHDCKVTVRHAIPCKFKVCAESCRHMFLQGKARYSYPCTGLERHLGLQDVEAPRISTQSAHEGRKVVSSIHWPQLHPPTRR